MKLHRGEGKLRCHYCGRVERAPERCRLCGSDALAQGAEGTERLEEEIRQALGEEARAVRLDSDTARGGGRALGRALTAFERGETQVLLGTQMVAKGHDFPNVTLVGVLCAEEILGFPDFRAAERTYQLIHQVSGRAGRGARPGRVLVQTFLPDHYAIRFGGRQDYDGFFEHEMRYRKTLRYPPFTVLVQLLLADSTAQRGWERASKVAGKLRAAGGEEIRVLGPALAPLARLRGRFRFQILVKGTRRRRLNAILSGVLEDLEKERFPLQALVVDVDPVSTL
jgi:primosomal protein N' (replication factor Y)